MHSPVNHHHRDGRICIRRNKPMYEVRLPFIFQFLSLTIFCRCRSDKEGQFSSSSTPSCSPWPRCLKCDTEASYHLFVSCFEQQRVSPLHIDARRGEEASLSSHSLPFEGGEGCPVLFTSIATRCEEGHSFSSHLLPFDTRRGGLSYLFASVCCGGEESYPSRCNSSVQCDEKGRILSCCIRCVFPFNMCVFNRFMLYRLNFT